MKTLLDAKPLPDRPDLDVIGETLLERSEIRLELGRYDVSDDLPVLFKLVLERAVERCEVGGVIDGSDRQA